MRFTWHESKRLRNLQKHRIDFVDARRIWEGVTLDCYDGREDYGEDRWVAVGQLGAARSPSCTPNPTTTPTTSSRPGRPRRMSKQTTGGRTRGRRRGADAPREPADAPDDLTVVEGFDGPAGLTDWAAVDAQTDDDIRRAVAEDPDAAPILDADWFATAERYMPRKTARITILVDRDVLDWFRAQGKGYQPRMNAVLRGYVESRAARERSK